MSVSEILPGLFLGNQHCAKNLDWLQTNKIRRIVTIGCRPYHPSTFQYMHIGLKDKDQGAAGFLDALSKVVAFINEGLSGDETCLVHCQAGMSRSPAMVVGWFMIEKRFTLTQALEKVQECRPSVRIQPHWIRQLELLEKQGNAFL